MNLVTPTIAKDIEKVLSNYKWCKQFILFDKLVFIGNDDTFKALSDNNIYKKYEDDIQFIAENSLFDIDKVRKYIAKITDDTPDCINKTGWYYQQFLKMGYARICTDESYLLWDSDTIPLREYSVSTDDGRLSFDVKEEHNPPYFETIRNLFNMSRVGDYSFISEHMIINTQIMRELLDELEKNGKPFWQTILDAVPREYLSESGFSEYETYGTYVINRHPNDYAIRQWTSLRQGTQFFDYNRMKKHDVNWLGKWFDAVSFEKNDTMGNHRKWLYRNRVLQRLFTFEQLVECERLYDRLRYEIHKAR